jgi:hypothetical protein
MLRLGWTATVAALFGLLMAVTAVPALAKVPPDAVPALSAVTYTQPVSEVRAAVVEVFEDAGYPVDHDASDADTVKTTVREIPCRSIEYSVQLRATPGGHITVEATRVSIKKGKEFRFAKRSFEVEWRLLRRLDNEAAEALAENAARIAATSASALASVTPGASEADEVTGAKAEDPGSSETREPTAPAMETPPSVSAGAPWYTSEVGWSLAAVGSLAGASALAVGLAPTPRLSVSKCGAACAGGGAITPPVDEVKRDRNRAITIGLGVAAAAAAGGAILAFILQEQGSDGAEAASPQAALPMPQVTPVAVEGGGGFSFTASF